MGVMSSSSSPLAPLTTFRTVLVKFMSGISSSFPPQKRQVRLLRRFSCASAPQALRLLEEKPTRRRVDQRADAFGDYSRIDAMIASLLIAYGSELVPVERPDCNA